MDNPVDTSPPKLGLRTRLVHTPGLVTKGEIPFYSDVLIPVLHQYRCSVVDKCNMCHYHLEGTADEVAVVLTLG